jgi:hypothetical protein
VGRSSEKCGGLGRKREGKRGKERGGERRREERKGEFHSEDSVFNRVPRVFLEVRLRGTNIMSFGVLLLNKKSRASKGGENR